MYCPTIARFHSVQVAHKIGHSFRERKRREEKEILPEISTNGREAEMRTCENVAELARVLEYWRVRPRCLYKWRAKLEAIEPGDETARPSTHAAAYRKENQRLNTKTDCAKRLTATVFSWLLALSLISSSTA